MRVVPFPNCTQYDVVEDVYPILMECVRNGAETRAIFRCLDYGLAELGILNIVWSRKAELLYLQIDRYLK